MSAIVFGSPAAAKVVQAVKVQAAIDAIDWDAVCAAATIYPPSDDDENDDGEYWLYGAEIRVHLLGLPYEAVGCAYEPRGAVSDAVEALKNTLARKVAELSREAVSNA